jgi:ribosome-associated translation inhibitor RaiA
MRLDVRTNRIPLTADLMSHIRRRLHSALGRFARAIERVEVRLTDENGPRNGIDQRCKLVLVPARGRPVLVTEHLDADPFAAVGRAAERAGRAFARALERRRARRTRRPRGA